MRETIKEYLTFSKKERTGILILMSVIVIIAVTPVFYSSTNSGYGDSTVLNLFKDQIAELDAADKSDNPPDSISSSRPDTYEKKYPRNGYFAENGKYPDRQNRGAGNEPGERNIVMFDFDPNTISTAGWVQLGLNERTALTIAKYRSKGGKFRKPDDILRIYGLSEKDKKRLLPFVKIANGASDRSTVNDRPALYDQSTPNDRSGGNGQQFERKIPEIIDINTADSLGWSSLPGIGPVLSQRIIKYRDRLGGFYSNEQVSEVFGLPDSTYQKIRPFLTCVAAVRKINVNVITPDILEQHPYFKRQVARAIVDYRSQHGLFKEIGELKQVVSITPELFARISSYIGL